MTANEAGPSPWARRLGWAALLLGPAPGLLLMAALLWACFAVDRVLYPRYRLRVWLPMRLQLTVVASLSCLAGAAALPRWAQRHAENLMSCWTGLAQ